MGLLNVGSTQPRWVHGEVPADFPGVDPSVGFAAFTELITRTELILR